MMITAQTSTIRPINRAETVLAQASSALPESSPIFNFIQNVRSGCLQIITVMPDLTDEQLRAVHDHSAELESFGWLVRAYARHEFMKRAVRLKQRSLRDVDEVGRVAIAKKLAVELHVSLTTIIEDTLIIERLIEGGDEDDFVDAPTAPPKGQNSDTVLNQKTGTSFHYSDVRIMKPAHRPEFEVLPEKEFWKIAARSENPRETLSQFAQQKTENPFFNTRDAYRQEKERKAPPLDEPLPPLIEQDAIRQWYGEFVRVMNSSPSPELRRIMAGAYEEVRYEVQKPIGTRRRQLLDLIQNNVDEIDLIANQIKVDRIHVAVWLNRLMEEDLIVAFEKERAPGARGAARVGHRLTEAGVASLKPSKNNLPR